MKISDYIMEFISGLGIKHVFYLSGGGAMHLDDSLGRNKQLSPVCMLHEQSCAIAAEAYARISEGYGACLVTSGPGATNTITGLAGAYIDSTPVIFISGQVKRADRINGQGIRQFGIQEVDIVSIVKPITKYAVQIENPEDIRYELEKAASIAKEGRPGPVWIDVPLDIQAMQVEKEKLRPYKGESEKAKSSEEELREVIRLMNKAKRPVLLIGNGIRLSGATKEIEQLYNQLQFPVLTTWNGVDLIEDEHELFYGRPGAVGQRYANFVQQNADFVLSIGTRLNLLSTGYDYESFLKRADHVMVDIDENEMKKCSVHPKLAIKSDAKYFINALLSRMKDIDTTKRIEWMKQCQRWKEKYPVFIKEQEPAEGYINTYRLVDEVTRQMESQDIYQFTSSGTSVDIAMQTFRIKKGQRAFLTKGLASMGFDLPACIGSCLAGNKRRTVCITGDGSFMMNIQELETLRRLQLPIKIFVVDNSGYGMIYNSQSSNFKGHLTGCNEDSGLTIPPIRKVVEGFGIYSCAINDEGELSQKVKQVLEFDGPVVCTVKVDIAQKILPRQTNYMKENGQMASRPLEDMSPLLDRHELEENLL